MPRPSVITAVWIIVLGLVGVFAGSIMPFLIDANPGNMQPIVGLFVFGPLGVVAGLILGAVIGRLRLSATAHWLILSVVAVAYLAGSTYFCVPYYTFAFHLVDGEIIECKDAQSLIEPREEYWREEVSRLLKSKESVDIWNVALFKERGDLLNWQNEVAARTRARTGTVLTLRVRKKAALYEAHWTSGQISRRIEWAKAEATEVYFCDAPPSLCAEYQQEKRSIWQSCGESWERYPPRNLPAFLGLDVIKPAPPEYATFLSP